MRDLMVSATAVFLIAAAAHGVAAREISGTVILPAGEPAAEARVRLFYVHCPTGYGMEELGETLSGADGVFSISVPDYQPPAIIPFPMALTNPPGLYLVAEKEDYAPVIQSAAIHRQSEFKLMFSEPITVQVRVIELEIGRIEGAYVWVSQLRYNEPRMRQGLETGELPLIELLWNAKTGEEGLAEFILPANVVAQVSAIMENGDAGHARMSTSDAGRVIGNLELRNMVVRIEGRVTQEDKTTPIAGQVVTMGFPRVRGMATTTPRGRSVAVSDEDGRFELAIIAPRGMEQFMGRVQPALIARDPSYNPAYADSFKQLPVGWVADDEFNISMTLGTQVIGKVVNDIDDAPLPGAVIQGTPSAPELRASASLYRLADADGAFRMKLDVDGALWRPQFPPPGYVNVGGAFVSVSTVLNRPAEVELRFPAAVEAPGLVKVFYPDGNPADGARVIAWQRDVNRGITTNTDSDGAACIYGLAAGRETILHVIGDGVFGAHELLPEMPEGIEEPVEITLRDGHIGTVRVEDEEGNFVGRSTVRIMLMGEGDEHVITPLHTLRINNADDGRIEGLQPNTRYGVVLGPPAGFRLPRGQRALTVWRFDEDEAEPTLTLRLQRPQEQQQPAPARRPRQPAGPPPRTEEDFREELRELERTAQSFEDPFDENTTWLADNDGRFIARADADSLEVRRFDRIFGYDRLAVTGMVFTESRVWVGTERGLMAWDRRHQYWGRYATGGLHIEIYVRELSALNGTLIVTTGRENEEPRRFEFDIEAGRWREM